MNQEWYNALLPEFSKPYYSDLYNKVQMAYDTQRIFPDRNLIFNAFEYTPLSKVKCVILGQDPYPNEGQAHGLSFSVPNDVELPPSLVNIYNEIKREYNTDRMPISGDLTYLAEQGVLLLNTSLTVIARFPGSHSGIGWNNFTLATLDCVTQKKEPVVYMLWGKHAQNIGDMIDVPNNHLILKASHPSPYSVNISFVGCNHFIKCNEHLIKNNTEPIDWIKNWR